MRYTNKTNCLLTGFLLIFLAALTCAQQTTGNVRGIVSDPTNAVVPNAKITLREQKTNSSFTTQSNGAGEYEFKNIPSGEYQLTVEANGFKTLTLNEVRVQLNLTTDVPANLTVGVP